MVGGIHHALRDIRIVAGIARRVAGAWHKGERRGLRSLPPQSGPLCSINLKLLREIRFKSGRHHAHQRRALSSCSIVVGMLR